MQQRLLIILMLLVLMGGLYAGVQALATEQDVFTIRTASTDLNEHAHEVGRDTAFDFGHHAEAQSEVVIAPKDMWITGLSATIENAPAIVLHHAGLFRLDKKDRVCPARYAHMLTFSQDQMHTPRAEFPEGYGMFVPKGTPLVFFATYHNPDPPIGPGGEYRNVRVVLNLHHADAHAKGLVPLTFYPLRLSDTPCSEKDSNLPYVFSVPPQREGYRFAGAGVVGTKSDTARITAERPMRIVYWGAHLHGWEGGRELRVMRGGQLLHTFETRRAADDPYRYDTMHGPTDVHLKTGDTLSIEAVYDNPTQETLRGAMGILGVYIAEE